MLTREEIISSFKKVDFPDKIIESNANDVKNIIFYTESTEPISKKEKDTQALNQSYVLPWRLLQKSYSEQINKNFNRGSNFVPKEEIIDIKIENLKFLYDKYNIPLDLGLFYFKNNYGGMNGPFNLFQIQNMYKIKKLDSTFEFRPIDIFGFKESDLFTFKSIKIINENNWIDSIIDSSLLKYNKIMDKKDEPIAGIKEEKKEKKSKIISENKKKELKEEKAEEKEVEKKEEKKTEKNEEKKEKNIEENKEKKKEDSKEIVKEKKDDSNNKLKEEKWELIQPKKSKSGKEKEGEDENNDIVGLKPKNTKEGKKGKKKKRQFEDVDIEFGFKIK